MVPSKIWLNIGNSILSGDAALHKEKQGRPPDSEGAVASDARASSTQIIVMIPVSGNGRETITEYASII